MIPSSRGSKAKVGISNSTTKEMKVALEHTRGKEKRRRLDQRKRHKVPPGKPTLENLVITQPGCSRKKKRLTAIKICETG